MKKNAKQMNQAEGQRATIRSTGTESLSQARIDLHCTNGGFVLIEDRDVRASHCS